MNRPNLPPTASRDIEALKGRVLVFYGAGGAYAECALRLNATFADPAAWAEALAGARLLAERAEAFARFRLNLPPAPRTA
jgi:hypothetical protein